MDRDVERNGGDEREKTARRRSRGRLNFPFRYVDKWLLSVSIRANTEIVNNKYTMVTKQRLEAANDSTPPFGIWDHDLLEVNNFSNDDTPSVSTLSQSVRYLMNLL